MISEKGDLPSRGDHLSFKLYGSCVELVVNTMLGDKGIMVTPLDDAAMIKDHDRIGVTHGGEAMGDHEHRPALHQLVHATLDKGFGMGIN